MNRQELKIGTHTLGNGWFTASIEGIPLIGLKGYESRFRSRKEAREAAQDRLDSLTDNQVNEIFKK